MSSLTKIVLVLLSIVFVIYALSWWLLKALGKEIDPQ